MKNHEKAKLISELNQFLLLKDGIRWYRLPPEDLKKIHVALIKLRDDVAEVLDLLDSAPVVLEDKKQEWKNYVS